MIHCGVSCHAQGLVLEKYGHVSDYKKCDVNGCLPPAAGDASSCANPSRISTEVNIHQVHEQMNQAFEEERVKLPTSVSDDAGR